MMLPVTHTTIRKWLFFSTRHGLAGVGSDDVMWFRSLNPDSEGPGSRVFLRSSGESGDWFDTTLTSTRIVELIVQANAVTVQD
jgi:hypothetical protein